MITHIKYRYQIDEFFGQEYHDIVFSCDIINRTNGTTNKLTASVRRITCPGIGTLIILDLIN
jgi:hypothetical protein